MGKLQIPTRKSRKFIGEAFELNSWEDLKPLYEDLASREINSGGGLKKWCEDRSELESYLSENMAWRYIKMTCDTTSEEAQKSYQFFVTEINPKASVLDDQLNKKVLESPFLDDLTDKGYDITLRAMKKAVEIFREENIPLSTEVSTKSTEYQAAIGAMTIEINGEEITLPKAGTILQSVDRANRKEAWEKIASRRAQDREKLDSIFNELLTKRNQISLNAGFKNYRDYSFAALGRFDYTPQDCFDFHEAVAEAIVPLLNDAAKDRKNKLKLDQLRPWDKGVDVENRPALKPFNGGDDLLEKAIACFDKIDKKLGDYLRIMKEMEHVDLVSRKGKAPGGYNYPLMEIGVPFIFMNATSSLRDVVTMVHEGGHAIHSFETRDLAINTFKNTTAEVAEVASMAMELISMEHWDTFFENKDELKRAKIEHLEGIITVLPWIATVDKFQHWIYENPNHTTEERQTEWSKIFEAFADTVTDWSGYEKFKASNWHRQLHIFELPFYYIEYGIAQLGAISVWRNYKKNPKAGLNAYLKGLRLGYTVTIGEIYEAMDIKFDFSKAYISELMDFVREELAELKNN